MIAPWAAASGTGRRMPLQRSSAIGRNASGSGCRVPKTAQTTGTVTSRTRTNSASCAQVVRARLCLVVRPGAVRTAIAAPLRSTHARAVAGVTGAPPTGPRATTATTALAVVARSPASSSRQKSDRLA